MREIYFNDFKTYLKSTKYNMDEKTAFQKNNAKFSENLKTYNITKIETI